ncbi:MAG TPA: DUF3000 family protein [Streptosporangiaceae bacterium]|nr:DUF3000 family protein [Streptosporangiaceae bacterium]
MSPAGRAAPRQAAQAAEIFRSAAAELDAERMRQAALRPELEFEDAPAPKKLAPYAAVLAAAVHTGGAEVATGRLILLYDPAGQPGWAGPFRIVAQIQAEVDPEIAVDPLLGQVGWSWLTDAFAARAARYTAPSGTVTRVVTEGFGAKEDDPAATEFELRASWSPAEQDGEATRPGLAGHVAAWCDTLCAAAGLAPIEPGVSALPPPAARQRAASGGGSRSGHGGRDYRGPAVR